MKSALKFLFNFIRNVSLVMVLMTVGLVLWVANDREFRQELITKMDIEEREQEKSEEIERQRKVDEIMAMSVTESDLEDENETVGLMGIEEVKNRIEVFSSIEERPLSNLNNGKLTIDVQGGKAYIRPSQIMYIEAAGNNQKIVTILQSEIITSIGMKKIEEALRENSSEDFFYTRSNIFNNNYIQQVYRESSGHQSKYNYNYWIIFENNKKMSIPRDSLSPLIKKLDKLTI